MRVVTRLGLLVALFGSLAPRSAEAIPIIVAEFRWEAFLTDPGSACDPGDTGCVPVDPTHFSTYSLTGLWDGLEPAPTLTGGVTLGGGSPFDWLPVSPDAGYFDQLGMDGILPTFASTTIFFDFRGETMSLSALLDGPGFATLGFDAPEVAAVPEPGTLALLALGLAGIAGRRARRTRAPRPLRP